eukprot:jgi/Chlat1/6937/Chrsp52S06603
MPLDSRPGWMRQWIADFPMGKADESKVPLIAYMHGGGLGLWRASTSACHKSCKRLAQQGSLVVASTDTPDHRCPAAHDGVYNALHWVPERVESEPWLAQYVDISRIADGGL